MADESERWRREIQEAAKDGSLVQLLERLIAENADAQGIIKRQRSAMDLDAATSNRLSPLAPTSDTYKHMVDEAVSAAEKRIYSRLADVHLPIEEDEDKRATTEKMRVAVNFPTSAWGFTKWVGTTLIGALLTSIVGVTIALFGWKK